MEELKILLNRFYQLVNNSSAFKDKTPGECFKEAEKIREEIFILKENYKSNEDLYNLLCEFTCHINTQ